MIHRTVYLFCALLPFGLVDGAGLLTPLFALLLAYAFMALEAIAAQIEDPFGTEENDLALNTMCAALEKHALHDMAADPDFEARAGAKFANAAASSIEKKTARTKRAVLSSKVRCASIPHAIHEPLDAFPVVFSPTRPWMSVSKPGKRSLNSRANCRYWTMVRLKRSPGISSGMPGGYGVSSTPVTRPSRFVDGHALDLAVRHAREGVGRLQRRHHVAQVHLGGQARHVALAIGLVDLLAQVAQADALVAPVVAAEFRQDAPAAAGCGRSRP